MTKEYLKMADVFNHGVEHDGKSPFVADSVGCDIAWVIYSNCDNRIDVAKYAAHAMRSQDELVEEVERLRGELSVASNALDEVDREISERIKNGAYDLDDISSEVSYALERLNRDAD